MNTRSRKSFIATSSLALAGICLGAVPVFTGCSPAGKKDKKTVWDGKKTHPRSIAKKKIKKSVPPWHKTEIKAMEELKQGNSTAASNTLMAEIGNEKTKKSLHHKIRLFDLMIVLCRRDPAIKDLMFNKTIDLAKQSGDKKLVAKSESWLHASDKKLKKQSTRKHWNKELI